MAVERPRIAEGGGGSCSSSLESLQLEPSIDSVSARVVTADVTTKTMLLSPSDAVHAALDESEDESEELDSSSDFGDDAASSCNETCEIESNEH